MCPVATDVAWSVCLLDVLVNVAKTAELIEMSFGLWTPVGPRKHVLDGDRDPFHLMGRGTCFCMLAS